LLAHGWPELWYSWRHVLPTLTAAGYHAVAPDMRGYGQTRRSVEHTVTTPGIVDYINSHIEDAAKSFSSYFGDTVSTVTSRPSRSMVTS
jgi:pimeloyl-ACP methyl ester carboxylesterase